MPKNDPIEQAGIESLTRKVEAVEDRVESLQVQTGGNFAAVIEGNAALRREVRDGFAALNGRIDTLTEEIRVSNARIVELLTALVGQQTGE
ncbi:hypothetical protein [Kitasatospora acidiphila]|uniref:hypothetical protein n=1 Tax=Kitasatospora acidiphila TaxID=2567942 RepID=UPI003C7108FE